MDYGLDYLRRKLAQKATRVRLRYRYYEMKNEMIDLGISTPASPQLRAFQSCLGWCAKAVDALADRLVFSGFAEDNFDLTEIYRVNNADILFDSAVLSALITSCCFIAISVDDDGYPRMQVIDGGSATGIIDPITQLLSEGYAVLERDENRQPVREAYYTARQTVYLENGKVSQVENHKADYALLAPVIFRPDAVRPFGHARISRACMALVQSALRTVKRAEISAEFYSFPQKYVLGTSSDAEPIDKLRATMSAFLEFTKDEDGDKPTVGQFTQQSMGPHNEQLRMFASLFAGETGLTLDDLGFATENPASAEAIKAAHETLRVTAERAQRSFGVGFLNAGYLAACVRDDFGYMREQITLTKARWAPTFRPDAAMLAGIGDGAAKINQAVPGYFGKENLQEMTGIRADV